MTTLENLRLWLQQHSRPVLHVSKFLDQKLIPNQAKSLVMSPEISAAKKARADEMGFSRAVVSLHH